MNNEFMEERAFDWDDQIEKENEFTLLPEGEYNFTIKSFTRGRHNGSEKLPVCNKAILKIEVTDGENKGTIEHNLFLHSKCEGVLSQFFISIGQKQHGEKLTMNWNAVVGATGKCKIGIETWKGRNNEEMKSNRIKRFFEPVPFANFTPGAF